MNPVIEVKETCLPYLNSSDAIGRLNAGRGRISARYHRRTVDTTALARYPKTRLQAPNLNTANIIDTKPETMIGATSGSNLRRNANSLTSSAFCTELNDDTTCAK